MTKHRGAKRGWAEIGEGAGKVLPLPPPLRVKLIVLFPGTFFHSPQPSITFTIQEGGMILSQHSDSICIKIQRQALQATAR